MPFFIECGTTLKIANDEFVAYETKSQHSERGNILRAFQSTDNTEFLIVFQDMSIHYLNNGRRLSGALSKP